MCPDPALLIAYLDGTLFSRDAIEVDRHTATCARCAALLESLRRDRGGGRSVARSRLRVAGLLTAAVLAMAAGGLWLARSGSSEAPAPEAPAPRGAAREGTTSTVPPPAAALPPAGPERAPEAPATAGPPEPPSTTEEAAAPPAAREPEPAAPEQPVTARPRVPAAPPDVPADAGADGLVLRDRDGSPVWRARDRVIERSADGGATWVVEYTADRSVRTGTLVDAEVAWLAGEDGLVLRRTQNGWFGTTPPSEGPIVGVRASSPSLATVTLEDGRVLRTVNAGVTWTEP